MKHRRRMAGRRLGMALLAVVAVFSPWLGASARAQAPAAPRPAAVSLTPAQLFVLADRARDAGDYATAAAAYRALSANPNRDLRTEARFRLGMMLADRLHRYRDAALEFRRILDEQPHAARVRLELARMHALLGNAAAAARELRAAQAAGLPPEVERTVRFYASALSARQRTGGTLELALAPDSNINRATRANTLGTVLGDFALNRDAQAHSGTGLALRGQIYARQPINPALMLLARGSASIDGYLDKAFDDFSVGVQVGPEIALPGGSRLAMSAGPGWRWYGTQPYALTVGGEANFRHPAGKRTELRLDLGYATIANRRNRLEDGDAFSLGLGADRAFSDRAGGGWQLMATRQTARDRGYATASGGASLYLFRELGRTTAVVNLGYSHLEADARLLLYPRRRIDDRFSASVAGTFRSLRIGAVAPLARIRLESNHSSIELYHYRRVAGELGITAAF